MIDHSDALSFAVALARLGGRIAMGHFGKNPKTKKKDDGTWVTEADWAAEREIRAQIARTFPDHNILGEEEGLTAAGDRDPIPGAPTWVVDPIDGTNNFMASIPVWATLVALQVDGRNVVGVAHAPALDETYDAAIGLGARMNGTEIAVDPIEDLSQALFVSGGAKRFYEIGYGEAFEKLTSRAWRERGFGDFWGHMLVARGAAHVMAEPELAIWDVAALEPIVTEAGGRLTHFDGSTWKEEGDVLTTCGSLHETCVSLIS